MSASAGILGKGTKLEHSADGTTGWAAVAELYDVNLPEFESEEVDFTHYLTDNNTKEYKPGWDEGSVLAFEANYTQASYATLLGLRRLSKYWRITFADTSTVTFQGYIKKIGGAAPNKEKVTVKGEIKVTTAPTSAAGS